MHLGHPLAHAAAHVAASLAGVFVVLSTCLSAVKTVVVPRAIPQRITRVLFGNLRRAFALVSHPKRPFADRDRWLALYAPVALVLLPLVWVSLVAVGFTLLEWGFGSQTLREAFLVSSSSLLTLGVKFRSGLPSAVLSFLEAALGLGLVALLISYLPTLYSSFSRREAAVGLLETRAGTPPSPTEVLVRIRRIDAFHGLDELFESWEQWFAEVEESHTSFPALVFFRSPQPTRSWITAGGCVLDTAAIRLAVVDQPWSPAAALCLRTGYIALRNIAGYFGVDYDPNPKPDDPISVTRREFDLMCVELEAADVPLKADRERAWRDFQGWRVNYDRVLVAVAHLVVAPEARWSSDRPFDAAPLRRRWRGLAR